MISLSYLITIKNEDSTLKNLLERIISLIEPSDEIIILDDFSDNSKTKQILLEYSNKINVRVCQHALDNDYGSHKNYGIEQCNGDFIFAIDADELPPETLLGENLHALLEENPGIEAYAIPRINDFRGVTELDARQWGWKLDISPTYERMRVNFPDYQFRIFLRSYPRISYKRRLHEKIEGYSKYCILPANEDYALYHDKTIEKQRETNGVYNILFTQEENRGHKPV